MRVPAELFVRKSRCALLINSATLPCNLSESGCVIGSIAYPATLASARIVNKNGLIIVFRLGLWSIGDIDQVSLDQFCDDKIDTPPGVTQAPMYYIALCAATQNCLPKIDGQLWLFDDRDESVYQHYHSEIRRHIAAGGIIAGLQKEIEDLKAQRDHPVATPLPWWRRLMGKS